MLTSKFYSHTSWKCCCVPRAPRPRGSCILSADVGVQGLYHQAILGDLNTMAHGIARLSPKFCKDKMRFWSIGQSEAQFWDKAVFQVVDPDTIPEQDSNWQQRAQADEYFATAHAHEHKSNTMSGQDNNGQD